MKPIVPVLGIAAVLLGGGVVVAPQFVPQDAIKTLVKEQLAKATGWQVRLDGRTTVGVFPAPVLQVENVGIAGVAAADGVEFAQVGRVDFGIGWLGLFTGSPSINSIELNDADLFLEVSRGGTRSWQPHAALLKSTPEASAWASAISRLQQAGISQFVVNGGRLDYRDQGRDLRFELTNLQFSGGVSGGSAALEIKGSANHDNTPYSLSAHLGSLPGFLSGTATSVSAELKSGEALSVNAAGQLAYKDAPVGSLKVTGAGNSLSQAAGLLGFDVAEGLESYSIDTQVQFSSTGVRTRGLKGAVNGLDLTGEAQATYLEDGIELKGSLNGDAVPFETILRLAGIEQPGSGVAEVDLSYLAVGHDIAQLQDRMELLGTAQVRNGRISEIALPSMLSVDGQHEALDDIDLDIQFSGLNAPTLITGSARWRGEPLAIEGEVGNGGFADLKFAAERFTGGLSGSLEDIRRAEGRISFATEDLPEFTRWYGKRLPDYLRGDRLRVSGHFASEGDSLNYRDVELFLDDLRVEGGGRIEQGERPKLTGRYALSELQLDHLLTRDGSLAVGGAERPYDFSVLRNVDVDLSLAFDRFSAGDLRGQQGVLRATSEAGRVDVELNKLQLYGGDVTGMLLLNGATVEPQFTADLTVSNVNAAPFFAAVSDLPRVDGALNAVMSIASEGEALEKLWKNMDGAVSFQLGSGVLYDLDLNSMIASLSAEPVRGWPLTEGSQTSFRTWGADVMFGQGRAQFQGLTFMSDAALIEGSGEVNLSDGRVDWDLQPSLLEGAEQASSSEDDHPHVAVAGTLMRPSFAIGTPGEAAAAANLAPVNERVKNTVAAKLRARLALQEKAKQLAPVAEPAEPVATASVPNGIDGAVITRDGPVVPLQKPQTDVGALQPETSADTAAPNAATASDELNAAPREPGSAPETISVEGIASGEADAEDALSTLEEGFGLPAGFLTGQ
ncbi:AsmA family protein [Pseudovibrio exalbescens]|uniref:AsmA family protein n=1 Tax=Pseudovibrio exalbescens TaxID=197461 RepID=UPI002365161E|nr:AsmA family protein [Pseudovibrio exalbescens]MDD7911771.1 AsmA family protein [Pseudovibrio exalbescens]